MLFLYCRLIIILSYLCPANPNPSQSLSTLLSYNIEAELFPDNSLALLGLDHDFVLFHGLLICRRHSRLYVQLARWSMASRLTHLQFMHDIFASWLALGSWLACISTSSVIGAKGLWFLMFFTTDPASRGLLAGCGAVVKVPAAVALNDGWVVCPFASGCQSAKCSHGFRCSEEVGMLVKGVYCEDGRGVGLVV